MWLLRLHQWHMPRGLTFLAASTTRLKINTQQCFDLAWFCCRAVLGVRVLGFCVSSLLFPRLETSDRLHCQSRQCKKNNQQILIELGNMIGVKGTLHGMGGGEKGGGMGNWGKVGKCSAWVCMGVSEMKGVGSLGSFNYLN